MIGIREKKKQETRDAIQEAAVKLFTDKGFERTSIEDIAKAAGIGKTTIYGYFATKDDIFIDYCDEKLDLAFQPLQSEECDGKPLLDLLVDFFMAQFNFVTKNREFGRQMLREMIFPREINEKAKIHDQRYLDILEGFIKTAQERGEIIETDDIFSLSSHFFSLYLGALAGWYTGYINTIEEAEEGMRILFNQVMKGIQV